MAYLSLSKLDDRVYAQLRMRSLEHHVSIEEEAKRIISAAVSDVSESLYTAFERCFGHYSNHAETEDEESLEEMMRALRVPHQPIDLLS